MFLVMLFQNCLAPTFSNEEKQQMTKHQIEMVKHRKYQMIEKESDHNDILTLKSFKMTSKFNKEERKEIREICKKQGIRTKWLYKIFSIESGGNTDVSNPKSYAAGLIGFLPSTAKYLEMVSVEGIIFEGKTEKERKKNENIYISDKIKQMSISEQLRFVDKYLTKITSRYKIRSFLDLYLGVFRPEGIGKPDDFILGHKNSRVVKENPSYMNNDSTITVGDIKTVVSLI
jgi:hypothetical protein